MRNAIIAAIATPPAIDINEHGGRLRRAGCGTRMARTQSTAAASLPEVRATLGHGNIARAPTTQVGCGWIQGVFRQRRRIISINRNFLEISGVRRHERQKISLNN
jgi:hypothetical protein